MNKPEEQDGLFQGGSEKTSALKKETPKIEQPKANEKPTTSTPPVAQEPVAKLPAVPSSWTQSLQIAQQRMKSQNIWDEKRIMKELGFARGLLEKNQQLRECQPESILNALLQCCRLGMTLNPALKLAALVAYGKECNFMPQYQGLIAVLKEIKAVSSMKSIIVYQDEVNAGCFSYNPAEDKMLHEPIYAKTEAEQKKREIYGVYSVAVLPDGTREIYFMPEWMILKRKAASKSANSSYSPWVLWTEEMYQKTVIRRHFNFLVQVQHVESERLSAVLEHEDKLADYEDKSGNTNVGGRFAEYTTVD
jgi:recombination protein RecT